MKGQVSYFFFSLLLIASGIGILTTGETAWSQVAQGALERLKGDSFAWNPLLDERLPRLIVILSTGSALAVSGAVMQALFHNPLATPSVLGTSCGGSLSVVLVFIFGLQHEYPYMIPSAAFSGCLLTLLLVYALSKYKRRIEIQSLILTGIAVSSLLIAIQGALLYAYRDHWQLIQSLTEWEAGSTSDKTWKHVHMQLPLTLVGLAGCLSYRREIDLLALGDEEAVNLGVSVAKVRWRLFLCVALLTGGAIAAIGVIAFFGLVMPHLLRKLHGPSNEALLPLCMIGGASVLSLMDLFLRFFEIHAISIGNATAIIGGLFFIFILLEERERRIHYA